MLILSPAQCKAARGLASMTQPQLASAADLGLSTIVDFERGRRQVSPEAISAIRQALESAGVEFVDAGRYSGDGGPGVRLKKG
ncbi:helix-turn-helix domain-containing protein [Chelatococcus asaccharovorans]|uniref:helix-turn-helix domain-containing protein n=1 Tax=Chelatococcus asaccharovorans TaxID=28210 RepID=UPI001AECD636|nr:helix-turn-helix transcriptional regulator [Chelatococcus asaccharovorans]MBS7702663.1 helix-turn-helix transcriptional regulator [Chelatococcus asaccharovorans]